MNKETKEAIKNLKKHVGENSYRSLKRGGTLNCWRNTSPHNWWVEGKRGIMHWHSDGWGDRPNWETLKMLFNILNESKERVVEYWGRDSKLPCHTTFVLKKQFLYKKKGGK